MRSIVDGGKLPNAANGLAALVVPGVVQHQVMAVCSAPHLTTPNLGQVWWLYSGNP